MTDNHLPTRAPQTHTELWRLEQLALVSQVATQVTGIYDLDELLVRVVGLIYQTFEFYSVSLYTLDNDRLIPRAMAGPSDNFVAENAFIPTEKIEIPMGEGIIGWVAANQQELVVTDVWHEKRFRYSPKFPNTQAEIALPLKVEDHLLGVLDVQLDYPEDFDESDLLVLRALAGQVSMAIEDTRLYGEASRRGDHLLTISAVSWAVASILNVDELLVQVSELIRKYFDYPCVQLFIVHPGSRQVEYRTGSGQRAELLKQHKPVYSLDDQRGIIPLVARTGRTVLANDVTTEPAFRRAEATPTITQSELTVPLIYSGKILGVLDVQSDKLNAFTPEDQATMETLAANIAVALRNANLYRMAQNEAKISNALLKVAAATQDYDDLDQALTAITQIASLLAEVDRCAIWLRTQGTPLFRPIAASGFGSAAVDYFQQCQLDRKTTSLIKQLNSQRTPIIITHAADDKRLPAELATRLALETVAWLPLVAHGELLGLMLVSFENQAAIRKDDLRLISGVAHQAAVAIESKYLYEQKLRQERLAHELELAQEIQTTLIPAKLPDRPGWQTAAAWQSAQEVGGDFYNVMPVAPNRLGIVIADVAGKGMPAAMYMALTRSLIRATAPGQTDPRQVLLQTNQLLIPDTRRGKFVSLFYAILNTDSGELVYSNAGHNPPLLVRANHTIESLWVPGMVLGVLPNVEPQLGCAHLHPGDGVVFYTDGVTEVFDDRSRIFGEERLREILRQTWDNGPQTVVDNVRQAVNRFSATALPNDDFTLLIFRREQV